MGQIKNTLASTTTAKSEGNSNTTEHVNSTPKLPALPMRCCRLMAAFIKDGSKTREEVDKLAPASNGPHYIGLIRTKLDIVLECEKVPFTTKDGESSWYGHYHSTANERTVMRDYLQARGLNL